MTAERHYSTISIALDYQDILSTLLERADRLEIEASEVRVLLPHSMRTVVCD